MHLQDGVTSLYIACQEGHVTTAQLLVEAGAFLDVQGNVSCNPDTANSPQVLVAVSILGVGGDVCTHSQECSNTTWFTLSTVLSIYFRECIKDRMCCIDLNFIIECRLSLSVCQGKIFYDDETSYKGFSTRYTVYKRQKHLQCSRGGRNG